MKKKIFITLISSLVVASTLQAGYAFDDAYDFTGEAFFEPPATSAQKVNTEKKSSGHKNLPPVKKVRLKLQREAKYRELINNEY